MDDVNLTAITEEAFFAKKYTLLAPIHGKKIVSAESFYVFYRYDTNTSASKLMSWQKNDVSCWTTFEPTVKGNLKNIVIVGNVADNLDIMLPIAV